MAASARTRALCDGLGGEMKTKHYLSWCRDLREDSHHRAECKSRRRGETKVREKEGGTKTEEKKRWKKNCEDRKFNDYYKTSGEYLTNERGELTS